MFLFIRRLSFPQSDEITKLKIYLQKSSKEKKSDQVMPEFPSTVTCMQSLLYKITKMNYICSDICIISTLTYKNIIFKLYVQAVGS